MKYTAVVCKSEFFHLPRVVCKITIFCKEMYNIVSNETDISVLQIFLKYINLFGKNITDPQVNLSISFRLLQHLCYSSPFGTRLFTTTTVVWQSIWLSCSKTSQTKNTRRGSLNTSIFWIGIILSDIWNGFNRQNIL